jgi:hypothetical protein
LSVVGRPPPNHEAFGSFSRQLTTIRKVRERETAAEVAAAQELAARGGDDAHGVVNG